MKEEQKLELYQNIIDKLLNNESLSELEMQIVKNDTDFQTYKDEFNLLNEGIRRSALQTKLAEVKALENKFIPASANVNKPSNRRKWFAAFGIIFLVALAYLYTQINKGGSYDKDFLLADNLVPFTDIDGTRSTDKESKVDAYGFYNKRDYKNAIIEFEKLLKIDQNPKHKFYMAVSLLFVNKFEEAQDILEDKELQNYKKVPVNYYLALSKIGTDDPKEAIQLLSNPTIPYPILDKKRKKMIRILSR